MSRDTLSAMRTSLAVAAVMTLAACRKETIDKPPPPDMADAFQELDAPSATFDAQTIAGVKASADDAINGLVGSGLPQRLLDEAKTLVDQGSTSQPQSTGSVKPMSAASFDGAGFGRVTRICDGWGADPTPDLAANGALHVTFSFTDLTVDPVVWGTADACRLKLGPSRIFVDREAPDGPPNVRIHLGGQLAPKDIGSRPVVIALGAHAQIDDADVRGDFVVRITPNTETFELAIPIGGGNVVAMISGKDVTGIRAKNGTFSCDVAGCKASTGEVLAW
jgi:hypothetical protein